jgi:hypothetical protein
MLEQGRRFNPFDAEFGGLHQGYHGATGSSQMCKEKKKLLLAYASLELDFSRTLTELSQQAGTLAKIHYEALRVTVDHARVKAKKARIAFDAHVMEHKC